jgi:phenylacetate-CoA ligase
MIGLLRRWRYRREIDKRRDLHVLGRSEESVRTIQLSRLNDQWARTVELSPYFARMRRERGLPNRFESLEQFVEQVPPTSRADVQTFGAEMQCRGAKPDFFRTTGGSTAQPLRLPAWHSEVRETRPDMWLARSWYGITPASSAFMLWGHSHLLGTGLAGQYRGNLRRFYDSLLGYRRFSAYDLRSEKLRLAADLLESAPTDYVIGYSAALDLFAQVNEDRAHRLRALGIKVIVATAESFPSEESAGRLATLFGCPIAMEYGAVETGLLAHTLPSEGYDTFWHTSLLDAEPSDRNHKLYVTSLFPRCFPLIRYAIGDNVVLPPGVSTVGIRRLSSVVGRCNDHVVLEGGAVAHSELFTHAIRMCSEVLAYQVVKSASSIFVRYVAARPLSTTTQSEIRDRLCRIHPSLRTIHLERVERLQQTVAGKTRMVVSE